MAKVKHIMVTLDEEQYQILKSLKGFGTKDAEIIRNVFIAYLSEKNYLKKR
jgi:KaiC/GvpD/RAD55 family RecA-like ATPase